MPRLQGGANCLLGSFRRLWGQALSECTISRSSSGRGDKCCILSGIWPVGFLSHARLAASPHVHAFLAVTLSEARHLSASHALAGEEGVRTAWPRPQTCCEGLGGGGLVTINAGHSYRALWKKGIWMGQQPNVDILSCFPVSCNLQGQSSSQSLCPQFSFAGLPSAPEAMLAPLCLIWGPRRASTGPTTKASVGHNCSP